LASSALTDTVASFGLHAAADIIEHFFSQSKFVKTFEEAVKEPLGAPDATVVQFLLHEAAHNHKYVSNAFPSVIFCDTLVRYRCPDNMQHGAMQIQRAFR
jgi:hypothetical protein